MLPKWARKTSAKIVALYRQRQPLKQFGPIFIVFTAFGDDANQIVRHGAGVGDDRVQLPELEPSTQGQRNPMVRSASIGAQPAAVE